MNARSFDIGGHLVGPDHPPLVIAEVSANHLGRIDRALETIEAAAACGAHAIKIQTYTADTITIDHDGPGFRIEDGLWAGRTLHELYREAETPFEWHADLFAKAAGDPAAFRAFLVEYGEHMSEAIGDEIDRLEAKIKAAVPGAKHVDLESD